jgi:hypothetical protein
VCKSNLSQPTLLLHALCCVILYSHSFDHLLVATVIRFTLFVIFILPPNQPRTDLQKVRNEYISTEFIFAARKRPLYRALQTSRASTQSQIQTAAMSSSSTISKTSSVAGTSNTVSAKSTARKFGTCKASIPSTCKAVSVPSFPHCTLQLISPLPATDLNPKVLILTNNHTHKYFSQATQRPQHGRQSRRRRRCRSRRHRTSGPPRVPHPLYAQTTQRRRVTDRRSTGRERQ